MNKILKVKNLKVQFNKDNRIIKAVDDISFDIEENTITGIIGESGSGKTVTAKAISNIHISANALITGSIQNDSKEISIIFQDPINYFDPLFSIGKQFIEIIRGQNKKLKKQIIYDLAIELLKQVKIENPPIVMKQYPHQLSNGMCQRVMIAMALSKNPNIIIADEPTSSLDIITSIKILNLFKEIQKNKKISIIIITHDLAIVKKYCDNIIVMMKGKVLEQGQVKDTILNPQHEYTKFLIKSLNFEASNLHTNTNLEAMGCPFNNKCDKKSKKCFSDFPTPIHLENNHIVYCYNIIKRGPTYNAKN